MLAPGYSTLFSMGLFATRENTMPSSESGVTVASFGSHNSLSSASSSSLATLSTTSTLQPPPKIHINTQVSSHSRAPGSPSRPRLRKRRSSLSVANSPLGTVGIRSPSRAAAVSYSRSVLMSPSKSQTIANQKALANEAGQRMEGQGQSFMQRMRAGPFR